MPRFFRIAGLLPVVFTAFAGVACTPIQPVVRDGVGNTLPLRNDAVSTVREVARSGIFDAAIDSTPDPDGKRIYFTATSQNGAGVFAVPSDGGEPEALLVGDPFVMPQGLAISSDGQTLFVADTGAGHVWTLPTSGGEAQILTGTEQTAPVGIEVKQENGVDMVYFSGAPNGEPGVWKVAANDGTAVQVAIGTPLVEPMGIAIAGDGTVYVVDHGASGNGLGSVFRIVSDKIEPIAENFRAGNLAGATLTLDDSLLLVSALGVDYGGAQVLLIDLGTLDKGVVTKIVSANAGSGGVHRAHNVNVFSWADYQGGGPPIQKPGHVYVIKP